MKASLGYLLQQKEGKGDEEKGREGERSLTVMECGPSAINSYKIEANAVAHS